MRAAGVKPPLVPIELLAREIARSKHRTWGPKDVWLKFGRCRLSLAGREINAAVRSVTLMKDGSLLVHHLIRDAAGAEFLTQLDGHRFAKSGTFLITAEDLAAAAA